MVVLLVEESDIQSGSQVDKLAAGEVPATPVTILRVEPGNILAIWRDQRRPLEGILERTPAAVPEVYYRVVRLGVDGPQGLKHVWIRVAREGEITLGAAKETDSVVGIGRQHQQLRRPGEAYCRRHGLRAPAGLVHRRQVVAVPVPDVQGGRLKRDKSRVLRRIVFRDIKHQARRPVGESRARRLGYDPAFRERPAIRRNYLAGAELFDSRSAARSLLEGLFLSKPYGMPRGAVKFLLLVGREEHEPVSRLIEGKAAV